MRTFRVSDHTMDMLREQTRPGAIFVQNSIRSISGHWDMPVDPEVAEKLDAYRLPGETDDQLVSRVIREATGQKPN